MALGIDRLSFVWDLASALLYHLAGSIDSWKFIAESDFFEERMDNLKRHGLLREIERRNMSEIDLNAYVYLLDRYCGIASHDWGYRRLYVDGFLIEQLVQWLGCRILLLHCNEQQPRVSVTGAGATAGADVFTIKMAHYDNSDGLAEHFNWIR